MLPTAVIAANLLYSLLQPRFNALFIGVIAVQVDIMMTKVKSVQISYN